MNLTLPTPGSSDILISDSPDTSTREANENMAKESKDQREGQMIHIRLPKAVHKQLRIRVAEEETTIQAWVAGLVAKALGISQSSPAKEKKR